ASPCFSRVSSPVSSPSFSLSVPSILSLYSPMSSSWSVAWRCCQHPAPAAPRRSGDGGERGRRRGRLADDEPGGELDRERLDALVLEQAHEQADRGSPPLG